MIAPRVGHRKRGRTASPLPSGEDRVALHFAEDFFTRPEARVFDVLFGGETRLEGDDCTREAGFTQPEARSLDVAVEDGLLEVGFRWRIENPPIAALEVSPAR